MAKPVDAPFIELQRVESTNNYAMGMVHDRVAQHGAAVFAHHQTAGKGQRQKQWLSQPHQNIALSLILAIQGLAPSQQPLLSMAVSVCVQQFFSKYAGDETKIKWPNDIYWRDRKAGGILIENVLLGHQWLWSVIGVGININQTEFDTLENKAVSLKQISGEHFDPLDLAKELRNNILAQVDQLPQAAAGVIADYNQLLYKKGIAVPLKQGSRNFTAIIQEVAPNGELVVQSAVEERFGVGDVVWIL